MRQLTRMGCLFAFLLLTVPVSAGQSPGWYIGAGGGQGEMEVIGHDRSEKINRLLTRSGITTAQALGGEENSDTYRIFDTLQYSNASGVAINQIMGSEDDDTDTYKIFVGYQFNDYWLVEGSWQDLGETDGTFRATLANDSVISGKIESEYKVAALMLIGQYPVFTRTNLLFKVGAHRWEHDFSLKGGGVNISDSDDDIDYMYGAGVSFDLLDSLIVRVEWERFDGIEDEDGADVKSLSLVYEW